MLMYVIKCLLIPRLLCDLMKFTFLRCSYVSALAHVLFDSVFWADLCFHRVMLLIFRSLRVKT